MRGDDVDVSLVRVRLKGLNPLSEEMAEHQVLGTG
jgi:hypothetical protein